MLDPARSRPELTALTSLRGLAALAVVLQHFSSTAQLIATGWIPSLVPHGYMAVDFFFVLSGFIMSYTYLSGFETLGLRAYGPFLWKRVARIFPLGIAVTAVILLCAGIAALFGMGWLFATLKDGHSLASVVAVNLLHLQGFLPNMNLNDPSWSVSVELGAYLLFPLLIWLMFKAPPIVTVGCTGAGIGTLLYLSSLDPTGGLAVRSPPLDLARCVVEFSFGMLVYRAFTGRSWLRAIGQDRWTWLVAVLAVGSLIARSDLAAAAVFPFLVLAFSLNGGAAHRVLSHPWLHYLGTISFSIYLIHNLFRTPEAWLVRTLNGGPISPPVAIAFAVAGSLSVLPFAAIAYRLVERPGRDALNSLVRRITLRLPLRPGRTRPAN